jgi:hypothetical protein
MADVQLTEPLAKSRQLQIMQLEVARDFWSEQYTLLATQVQALALALVKGIGGRIAVDGLEPIEVTRAGAEASELEVLLSENQVADLQVGNWVTVKTPTGQPVTLLPPERIKPAA